MQALLQQMADGAPDDKLATDLSRLITRAETRTIYLDLSKQDAKKFLDVSIAGMTAGTLFAVGKKEEAVTAVATPPIRPEM